MNDLPRQVEELLRTPPAVTGEEPHPDREKA